MSAPAAGGGRGDARFDVFFDRESSVVFDALVEATLRALRTPFEVEDGFVFVPRRARAQTTWPLLDLAQQCRAAERDAWPALAEAYFAKLAALEPLGKDVYDATLELARAEDLLKVKLYPTHQSELASRPVACPVADGLSEFLVLDHPDHVAAVGAEKAAGWGRPHDELFRMGRAAVRAEPRLREDAWEFAGGVHLRVFSGKSVFASTHALWLEDYVESGEHGALVAVPDRHTILHHPIEKESFERALWHIAYTAQRMESEGPGSISKDLYWWRPGRWVTLPSVFENDAVRLDAPHEFVVEVLDRLA